MNLQIDHLGARAVRFISPSEMSVFHAFSSRNLRSIRFAPPAEIHAPAFCDESSPVRSDMPF